MTTCQRVNILTSATQVAYIFLFCQVTDSYADGQTKPNPDRSIPKIIYGYIIPKTMTICELLKADDIEQLNFYILNRISSKGVP